MIVAYVFDFEPPRFGLRVDDDLPCALREPLVKVT